jgi:GNAT superfamily N-acetyltransferase
VSLRLEVDRLDSPGGARLARALVDELIVRYEQEDELDGLAPDQLDRPHGTFLVAWLDDVAVGCGGLRKVDDGVGELKRMFVAEQVRRRGVARALLERLERDARALGYGRLVLETGTKQPEAIELYLAHDYEPIEPYGAYRDSPLSRCFAKSLGA